MTLPTTWSDADKSEHAVNPKSPVNPMIQMLPRVYRMLDKVLDGFDRALDALMAEPAPIGIPPVGVLRRQIANTLGLSQLCANRTCRRGRACRGEPLHCLQTVAFLLPEEAFDGLLHKQPARRRRRPRGRLARGERPAGPRAIAAPQHI